MTIIILSCFLSFLEAGGFLMGLYIEERKKVAKEYEIPFFHNILPAYM
jgi:hypothetical protein